MIPPKLIVVDDEPDIAGLICEIAQDIGYDVEQFNNAAIFRDQYQNEADVIILDLMMPGVDGVEVIRFLSEVNCRALLILVSGFDAGVLHSAQKLATEQGLNFAGTLKKPFRYNELHQLLSGLSVTPENKYPLRSPIEPPSKENLKEALDCDELVVYFHPKIGFNSSSIPAVEALVRWQHPQYGLLAPDLFIPTAEQHGLIDDLTWAVINKVMAQCRIWLDGGTRMQVAVNMSAHTLKDLDLPEKMGKLIKKYRLASSQIVLEVTETVLMQELTKSLDILTRLRMKGFHLSIDDFGTGYSSLVQLHRAPFSEIKIDRSFVMEMENDAEAATIVETIIMLGHKLNMKLVAEGVETKRCLQRLETLACDIAQGYYFTKPMPAEDVIPWFENHKKSG